MKLITLCLAAVLSGAGSWIAPKTADTVQNPFKGHEEEAALAGKKLFTTNCAPCHGEKGKGDGVAAAGLNPKPANFINPDIMKETDGALFWKVSTGKSPMPAWEKPMKPEQRWQVICYIRSLQTKKK
jgi:mono/diheme cytochrome c family protein